jgi:hypothetical protein
MTGHSVPGVTGGSAASACRPAGSRTLAAGPEARVFALSGRVFGCAVRTGRRTALGSATTCLRQPLIGAASVSGERIAYGRESCGVDTGTSVVEARDLVRGRVLYAAQAITGAVGPESYSRVRAVVLAADGACAWIASTSSIVRGGERLEVHTTDGRRSRLLDSGSGIVATSLRLRGHVVRWRSGSQARSARL